MMAEGQYEQAADLRRRFFDYFRDYNPKDISGAFAEKEDTGLPIREPNALWERLQNTDLAKKLNALKEQQTRITSSPYNHPIRDRLVGLERQISEVQTKLFETPEYQDWFKAQQRINDLEDIKKFADEDKGLKRTFVDVARYRDVEARLESLPARTPVHGTDLEKLDDILLTGLKANSPIDLTGSKRWAKDYGVTVVVPTAQKGRRIAQDNLWSSVGKAPVERVIINKDFYPDADRVRRVVNELRLKYPKVQIEVYSQRARSLSEGEETNLPRKDKYAPFNKFLEDEYVRGWKDPWGTIAKNNAISDGELMDDLTSSGYSVDVFGEPPKGNPPQEGDLYMGITKGGKKVDPNTLPPHIKDRAMEWLSRNGEYYGVNRNIIEKFIQEKVGDFLEPHEVEAVINDWTSVRAKVLNEDPDLAHFIENTLHEGYEEPKLAEPEDTGLPRALNPDQQKLTKSFYNASQEISKLLNPPREREVVADGKSYVIGWSNGSRSWYASRYPNKNGETVKLYANQVLVKANTLRDANLIAQHLPIHPLDKFSAENNPLLAVEGKTLSQEEAKDLFDILRDPNFDKPDNVDAVKATDKFMDAIRSPEQKNLSESEETNLPRYADKESEDLAAKAEEAGIPENSIPADRQPF